MNIREQRVLRDQASRAGRGDLAESLDKLNAELEELDDRSREAHRAWRAASDVQDAKAAELRELGRQIRDLTDLPVLTTHEGRTIDARNNIPGRRGHGHRRAVMIGNGYWSTGIIVEYRPAGGGDDGWAAKVEYLDDGFVNDDADALRVSTEGVLRTRYAVRQGKTFDALSVVIDTIKADAERLGIRWRECSHVYYDGDSDGLEGNGPPEGWRPTVNAQSERLGWEPAYVVRPAGQNT